MKVIITESQYRMLKEGMPYHRRSWLRQTIDDIKFQWEIYLMGGLLVLYTIVGGIQIYQKHKGVSNQEYFEKVLEPSLMNMDKTALFNLSKDIGEKNYIEYIKQHPDEFVVSEKGDVYWSH